MPLLLACLRPALIALAVTIGIAAAQQTDEARTALQQKEAAKLTEPWLGRADWAKDLEAAEARAKKSGKPIFVYFTRSYEPCLPCKELESTLFSRSGAANPDFQRWVADYVPYVHVTSHLYDEPHHDLLTDRGGHAFPTVGFLDADGELLALHDGPLTLAALDETAARARQRLALARRAAGGDDEAATELTLFRLQAEAMSHAEAEAAYRRIRDRLDQEQRTHLEQGLVNKEVTEAIVALQRQYGMAGLQERGPALAAQWLRAGKVPTNTYARYFYPMAWQHARSTDDRALAQQVVDALAEHATDDPRLQPTLESYRHQLEQWPAKEDGGQQ